MTYETQIVQSLETVPTFKDFVASLSDNSHDEDVDHRAYVELCCRVRNRHNTILIKVVIDSLKRVRLGLGSRSTGRHIKFSGWAYVESVRINPGTPRWKPIKGDFDFVSRTGKLSFNT